ncbi:MAG TPA: 3-oxoadipate enol-lactonase [Streptosporangiaceae bacterium]|nr:3-oxoadipate enol-lactonase [Streptosporangiaceae bacterium]
MQPAPVPLAMAAPLSGPLGAPVLVLGNSLGTSAAVWEGQVGELGKSFRLLRYEFPGHGGSAAAAGPYTIAGLGAGVLALLDSLGIRRAGYCGISLGGMVGMWLASHAPDRVAALGLVCTSAYLPPADGWYTRAARVRTAGLTAISAAVISRWFTPAYAAAAPSVIEQFRVGLEDTDPEGYACCCEAIAGMDQRADLAAITAPALVIAGADDPATPPEHGAAIAARIGGARLEVIPDAAHLAAVSAPDAVTDALSAHLSAAAAGDAIWRDGR